MRAFLIVFLAAALVAPVSAQAAVSQNPVRSIVFLGFQSEDIPASGLAILSELVRREISIAPGFALVERADLDALLREQELSLSDAFDPKGAVRIGRLTGAQSLMVGRIGILGTLYIISLRIVDVETGTVERAMTEEFMGNLEDIRKPVRVAAQKILRIPGIEVQQGEYIRVDTEPPGVAVYVNGLFEGNGPVTVRVPKPGKYAVKLDAEGYKTWTQNVTVEANSTYFVKARLLRQEKVVDERVRALQDGRTALLTFATLYSAVASEALLYAFQTENPRLYLGLPLVAAPLSFFGALKATEGAVMNGGRTFMIVSSTLWGSTWGFAASFVFGAEGGANAGILKPEFAGLSVAGGLLYGAASTYLSAGGEPFPASRAWLFNLGSLLGAFLGLGVPYVLGAESPTVVYIGMLSGSLAGSATALWLTRDFTEGRNIGNLALGSLIEADPGSVSLGLPAPTLTALPSRADGRPSVGLYVPLATVRY